MSVFGVGALPGALLASSGDGLPTGRRVGVLALATATAIGGTAIAPTLWLAIIGLLAVGLLSIWFIAAANTLVQLAAGEWDARQDDGPVDHGAAWCPGGHRTVRRRVTEVAGPRVGFALPAMALAAIAVAGGRRWRLALPSSSRMFPPSPRRVKRGLLCGSTSREGVSAMTVIGSSDLDVFPLGLGGNTFGWTSDRGHIVRRARRVRRGRRQPHRHRRLLQRVGAGERGRRVGDDHRRVDRGPRQPGPVVIATKVSRHPRVSRPVRAERRSPRPTRRCAGCGPATSTCTTRTTTTRRARRRGGGASRRAAEGGEDPARRALQLHRAAAPTRGSPPRPTGTRPRRWRSNRTTTCSSAPPYETELAPAAAEFGLGVLPYYALAGGFLAGKYRGAADHAGAARQPAAARYLTPAGLARARRTRLGRRRPRRLAGDRGPGLAAYQARCRGAARQRAHRRAAARAARVGRLSTSRLTRSRYWMRRRPRSRLGACGYR